MTPHNQKTLELAADFGVESLRLGSYEMRRRLIGYDIRTISVVREKREAVREKLSDHLERGEPDCRTCKNMRVCQKSAHDCYAHNYTQPCINGSEYQRVEFTPYWRTE